MSWPGCATRPASERSEPARSEPARSEPAAAHDEERGKGAGVWLCRELACSLGRAGRGLRDLLDRQTAANEGVDVGRERPVARADLAADARIPGEPPAVCVVPGSVRPAARRVLVPPGEAGVEDREDEPPAGPEHALDGGERA